MHCATVCAILFGFLEVVLAITCFCISWHDVNESMPIVAIVFGILIVLMGFFHLFCLRSIHAPIEGMAFVNLFTFNNVLCLIYFIVSGAIWIGEANNIKDESICGYLGKVGDCYRKNLVYDERGIRLQQATGAFNILFFLIYLSAVVLSICIFQTEDQQTISRQITRKSQFIRPLNSEESSSSSSSAKKEKKKSSKVAAQDSTQRDEETGMMTSNEQNTTSNAAYSQNKERVKGQNAVLVNEYEYDQIQTFKGYEYSGFREQGYDQDYKGPNYDSNYSGFRWRYYKGSYSNRRLNDENELKCLEYEAKQRFENLGWYQYSENEQQQQRLYFNDEFYNQEVRYGVTVGDRDHEIYEQIKDQELDSDKYPILKKWQLNMADIIQKQNE